MTQHRDPGRYDKNRIARQPSFDASIFSRPSIRPECHTPLPTWRSVGTAALQPARSTMAIFLKGGVRMTTHHSPSRTTTS